MFSFDKRLIGPVFRASALTIVGAVVATAIAVTIATVIGLLPAERWWFELKISSGIAMIVTALIAPIVISKFMNIAQQLRDAKAELQEQADTDYLTGLSNRRAFENDANRLIADAKQREVPLSLICIDIDHFKSINDRYGHAGGDTMLRATARTIQSALARLPDGSYSFARMGGEEFSCLALDLPRNDMMALAESMRLACDALSVVHQGREIQATVSIGAAIMSHRDGDLDQLMMAADKALYKAKQEGRNKAEFENLERRSVA